MKSLLVDNRVLLANNVSRKQYTHGPLFILIFQVLSDTVDYDEISVKKLFEFISESKTGLLF